MTLTRTRLRCNERECPARDDEEFHVPVCGPVPDHGHRHDQPTHQHIPKKGMGGNNPKSKIRVVICQPIHDLIDNGPWGNSYIDGEYRIYDHRNKALLRCRPLGASSDGTQGQYGKALSPSGESPGTAEALGPSPDVPQASAFLNSEGAGPPGSLAPNIGASTATGEGSRGIELSGVATRTLPAAADASVSVEAPASEGGGTRPSPLSPNLADDAGRDSRDGVIVTTPAIPVTSPSIAESLKPNGLDLPDEFTFGDWTELAKMVTGMNLNRQWWAGDLILAGERFGERATQHWNDLGYKYESLANCVRVCRRFPRPLRHENLSFSHHAVVYAFDDEAADQWLRLADGHGWNVAQTRREVHGEKPRTVRFSVDELRAKVGAFRCNQYRNHGRNYLLAYLDALEGLP